jgi:hypothetical protein
MISIIIDQRVPSEEIIYLIPSDIYTRMCDLAEAKAQGASWWETRARTLVQEMWARSNEFGMIINR